MKDNQQLSLFGNPFQSLINDNTRDDEWVNATKWCQHYNKDWYEFSRSKETKAFIKAIEQKFGNGNFPVSKKERNGKQWIMWIHPLLAIKLAEWLDPEFDVYVKETFKAYLDGDIRIADSVISRNNNPDDLKWLQKRLDGKIARRGFTDELQKHGVTGEGYAMNTDAIYSGLFGKTAKQIKEEKGVKKGELTRDHMDLLELSAVSLAEIAAIKRIEKENAFGNKQTTHQSAITSIKIKQALSELLD